VSRGLLVAGTTSDAGKSVLTAGICRWLYRLGVRVAPFKAQNMSNNPVAVDADGQGGEIDGPRRCRRPHRAGAERAFNPILLARGRQSQSGCRRSVRRWTPGPSGFTGRRTALRDVVLTRWPSFAATTTSWSREGAGSPTEINLRAGDLANMGLARPPAADDRGG
jgi:adenosylcobyric acid synthase